MTLKFKYLILALFGVIFISACKDDEIDTIMEDYCACIHKFKNDAEGRYECIELMDRIQRKYQNQPRQLNQIIESTNNCY